MGHPTSVDGDLLLQALAELSHAELRIFLVLEHHCFGTKRTCWPSLNILAELTGLTRSSVTRALSSMETREWVRRERGGGRGRATRYTLKTGAHTNRFISDKQVRSRHGTGAHAHPESLKEGKRERAHPGSLSLDLRDDSPGPLNGAGGHPEGSDPELTWRELCGLVRDPFILDYREGTRRSDIAPAHLREEHR